MSRLIEVFSKPEDLVVDTFAGSGSTLVAAQRLGRHSLGFEISEEYVELANNRLSRLEGEVSISCDAAVINEDACNLLKHVKAGSVTLCVTSPPYWDILNRKRTADNKKTRNYGDNESDISLIENYNEFIQSLGEIFEIVYTALEDRGYLVVNVMDLRKGAAFYPFHIDLSSELVKRGYTLDDIIIWDRRKEYNNLRPLGYPYVFRINKIHEYLLIFQKRI